MFGTAWAQLVPRSLTTAACISGDRSACSMPATDSDRRRRVESCATSRADALRLPLARVGADAAHQLVEHREVVEEALRPAALVGELGRSPAPTPCSAPRAGGRAGITASSKTTSLKSWRPVMLRIGFTVMPGVSMGTRNWLNPWAPVPLGGRGGTHQRDHVVGAVGVAGPHLAPVEPPPVPDPLGPAAQREEIRTRVRLAHADAEVAFAGRNPGQDVAADRLLRVLQQHRAALAVRHPVRPHRRTHREQLLGGHVALEEGALSAPVARWPGHPDEAGRPAAPAELRRVPCREPAARVGHEASRLHLAIDELAHPRAHRLRLGRQLHRNRIAAPAQPSKTLMLLPAAIATIRCLRSGSYRYGSADRNIHADRRRFERVPDGTCLRSGRSAASTFVAGRLGPNPRPGSAECGSAERFPVRAGFPNPGTMRHHRSPGARRFSGRIAVSGAIR